MDHDTEIIRNLVAAEGSLPELIAAAGRVQRANVGLRAQVTAEAVLSVLDRWERGEVSAETVQLWADAVGEPWSDDVEAAPEHAYATSMALFWLSVPEVNGPLDAGLAAEIRASFQDMATPPGIEGGE